MDATTWLGLAGIAGTLLGAALGADGTLGAAWVSDRGQVSVKEQKARRQAYGACATVLLARRNAADTLLETFLQDSLDPAETRVLLEKLDLQGDSVARAVGVVAVEGPSVVADRAENAAYATEELAGRLRDWLTSITGGDDREELIHSQRPFARDDQRTMQRDIDSFTEECRRVLHPGETRRQMRRRRRIGRRRLWRPWRWV
jgi:hypothetical protein